MSDLWIGAWIACLVTGVVVWGLIGYCIIRLPAPARRRDPAPDPLPPADRDALHGRAAHRRGGVLLLHRREAGQDARRRGQPRPPGHRDGTAVVVDVQLPRRAGDRRRRTSTTPGRRPTSRSCGWSRTSRSTSSCTRPTSSTRSGCPSFYFKMDVIPGRQNSFSMTPTRYGVFQGRCAELCGVPATAEMLFQVHVVTPAAVRRPSAERSRRTATPGVVLGGEELQHTVEGLETGSEGSSQ